MVGCGLADRQDLLVKGLKPEYGPSGTMSEISIEAPRKIDKAGRILYLSPRLFINEIDKGIHVVDNSDPENPKKEAFIHIPYNRDMAVKGQYLYVDNLNDLVVLRYFSKDSIQIVHRLKEVFDLIPGLPENYRGYFECPDATMGDVTGWIEAEILNPECRQ